jgi:hypothetical protein
MELLVYEMKLRGARDANRKISERNKQLQAVNIKKSPDSLFAPKSYFGKISEQDPIDRLLFTWFEKYDVR